MSWQDAGSTWNYAVEDHAGTVVFYLVRDGQIVSALASRTDKDWKAEIGQYSETGLTQGIKDIEDTKERREKAEEIFDSLKREEAHVGFVNFMKSRATHYLNRYNLLKQDDGYTTAFEAIQGAISAGLPPPDQL